MPNIWESVQGLDGAVVAHIEWVGRIVAATRHGRVDPGLWLETATIDCAFGRWLAAARRTADDDSLAAIDAAHRDMHACAADLLDLVRQHRPYFDLFDTLSAKVADFNRTVYLLERRYNATTSGA